MTAAIPERRRPSAGSTVVVVRVVYSSVVMPVVTFSAVVSATVVMSPTLPPRAARARYQERIADPTAEEDVHEEAVACRKEGDCDQGGIKQEQGDEE